MFSAEERDRVQGQLLARAEADDAIVGAAFTGSYATGAADRWSDTDLVLAVRGELPATLDTDLVWLYDELGARHHWDLPAGSRVIRVFLLPDWLELGSRVIRVFLLPDWLEL
ncbi:nucleotidyltransferase domain-containing protein, partial [Streptomyces sp. MCAF7]